METTVSAEDYRIILRIAERASKLAPDFGTTYSVSDAVADITAAHNARPLRLTELLDADIGTFGHDVFGIRKYLDRETGKLTDCFLPRMVAR